MSPSISHAQAIAARWTGTLYGQPFSSPDGSTWRQVFYYEAGRCTDAHMTKVGTPL